MLFLRCKAIGCGEIVTVSGETSVEPQYDDDGDWGYVGMLRPRSMYPAPNIIKVPEETRHPVLTELSHAYQLFWADYDSCATKIRTSVERLMDHFKVAKFRRAKKNLASRESSDRTTCQFELISL